MYAKIQRTFLAFPLMFIALGSVGCSMSETHDDAVNAAEQRWLDIRSAMVLQEAQGRFESGDLEQARQSLKEALRMHPTNPELLTLLGRIFLEQSQLELANRQFKAAIESQPNHAPAYYYRGIILQRWQKYEDSLASYRQAAQHEPTEPGYMLASAELLIYMQRIDEAEQLLLSHRDVFEGNAGLRVALAQIYRLKHEYSKAVASYREAMILEPEDQQIVEQLALTELAAGQYERSAKRLGRLLDDPDFKDRVDLQHAYAEALQGSGQLTEAKSVYLQLTRTNTRDAKAWLALGRVAWEMDDLNGALFAAEQVIHIDGTQAEPYLLAAMVWQTRDNPQQALAYLDLAVQLDSSNTTAWVLRGLAQEATKQDRAAADSYKQALKVDPQDRRAERLLNRITIAE